MAASSGEPIAGAILIGVTYNGEPRWANRRIEAFLYAASAGWFGGKVSDITRSEANNEGTWRALCSSLPRHAIGVLHGMLQHLVDTDGAATSFFVKDENTAISILRASYPPWEGAPPLFPVFFNTGKKVAPPLSVVTSFKKQIPADSQQQLLSKLGFWSELLRGGFAEVGEAIGASGIAAVSISFLNPRLVVLASDGYHAAQTAFVPLWHLLREYDRNFVIERVDLE